MQFTGRLILLIIMLLSTASYQAIAIEPGKVTGGVNFETPDWFKDSFLEIASDVEEANEAGKHVLLFFHLNACPYCNITVNQQFQKEPLKSFTSIASKSTLRVIGR